MGKRDTPIWQILDMELDMFLSVAESRDRNENLTEQIYAHLVKGLGYASMEEAEEAVELKSKGEKRSGEG